MKDNELSEDETETVKAEVLRIKLKAFGKKFTSEGNLEISSAVDTEPRALDYARRSAAEQAGIYLESYSCSVNFKPECVDKVQK